MLLPKAPLWFVHRLKELSPTLGVTHSGTPQGWRITQAMPYRHDYGWWEDVHLFLNTSRKQHIMYIPEIGSKVFQELNECWSSRFKNFDDYCKHFNILTKDSE